MALVPALASVFGDPISGASATASTSRVTIIVFIFSYAHHWLA
ncbi:hypothetical protein A2U01_0111047 [Trifolium medium]|uniref:Uncharacterized protein n=1 Tax=Trifolium medium TaxID=97028 RepID=A0A392VMY1_9FABA|nr:hypothetical protein [Trifolium medium]